MAKFLITIDVEGHVGNNPIDHLMLGIEKNGTDYGCYYMHNEMSKRHISSIFFIDFALFYQHKITSKMNDFLKILKISDSCALHIHPDHILDGQRKYLYQYSNEEQKYILSKCGLMYETVMGKKPNMFRAGVYSANNLLINNLPDSIKFDLSENWINEHCKINITNKTNFLACYNNVIEIPAFIIKPSIFGGKLTKLDLGLPHRTFKHFINLIIKHASFANEYICIFFHSHSLLNWRNNPNCPTHGCYKVKNFLKNIDFLSCYKDMVISQDSLMKDSEHLMKNLIGRNNDGVILKEKNILRSVLYIVNTILLNYKNSSKIRNQIRTFLLVSISIVVLIVVVILLCVLL